MAAGTPLRLAGAALLLFALGVFVEAAGSGSEDAHSSVRGGRAAAKKSAAVGRASHNGVEARVIASRRELALERIEATFSKAKVSIAKADAHCVNVPAKWVDHDGDGCDVYGEKAWCNETWIDHWNATGHTAKQACCACGGGKWEQPEVKKPEPIAVPALKWEEQAVPEKKIEDSLNAIKAPTPSGAAGAAVAALAAAAGGKVQTNAEAGASQWGQALDDAKKKADAAQGVLQQMEAAKTRADEADAEVRTLEKSVQTGSVVVKEATQAAEVHTEDMKTVEQEEEKRAETEAKQDEVAEEEHDEEQEAETKQQNEEREEHEERDEESKDEEDKDEALEEAAVAQQKAVDTAAPRLRAVSGAKKSLHQSHSRHEEKDREEERQQTKGDAEEAEVAHTRPSLRRREQPPVEEAERGQPRRATRRAPRRPVAAEEADADADADAAEASDAGRDEPAAEVVAEGGIQGVTKLATDLGRVRVLNEGLTAKVKRLNKSFRVSERERKGVQAKQWAAQKKAQDLQKQVTELQAKHTEDVKTEGALKEVQVQQLESEGANNEALMTLKHMFEKLEKKAAGVVHRNKKDEMNLRTLKQKERDEAKKLEAANNVVKNEFGTRKELAAKLQTKETALDDEQKRSAGLEKEATKLSEDYDEDEKKLQDARTENAKLKIMLEKEEKVMHTSDVKAEGFKSELEQMERKEQKVEAEKRAEALGAALDAPAQQQQAASYAYANGVATQMPASYSQPAGVPGYATPPAVGGYEAAAEQPPMAAEPSAPTGEIGDEFQSKLANFADKLGRVPAAAAAAAAQAEGEAAAGAPQAPMAPEASAAAPSQADGWKSWGSSMQSALDPMQQQQLQAAMAQPDPQIASQGAASGAAAVAASLQPPPPAPSAPQSLDSSALGAPLPDAQTAAPQDIFSELAPVDASKELRSLWGYSS